MISNDKGDELNAIIKYNSAIKLAREVDDQGPVDLLTKILKMEEGLVDWAEMQRSQIEQMALEGEGNFGLLTCNNNHLRVSHFIS